MALVSTWLAAQGLNWKPLLPSLQQAWPSGSWPSELDLVSKPAAIKG